VEFKVNYKMLIEYTLARLQDFESLSKLYGGLKDRETLKLVLQDQAYDYLYEKSQIEEEDLFVALDKEEIKSDNEVKGLVFCYKKTMRKLDSEVKRELGAYYA